MFLARKKLWGLINYQPRWGLTFKGWLFMVVALIAIALFVVLNIHSFLAPVAPIKAEALVIEGWIGDEGIKGAIAEFQQQDYQILITVGTPLPRGAYLSEYQNFAQLSAATAIKLGFNPDKIVIISIPPAKRDRTLASAIEVKKWFAENYRQVKAINLYSKNVHSRRSWLLYKRVLNPDIRVGILSQPPIDYEANSWWTSSEGFRQVTGEAIAYIYAKFFN